MKRTKKKTEAPAAIPPHPPVCVQVGPRKILPWWGCRPFRMVEEEVIHCGAELGSWGTPSYQEGSDTLTAAALLGPVPAFQSLPLYCWKRGVFSWVQLPGEWQVRSWAHQKTWPIFVEQCCYRSTKLLLLLLLPVTLKSSGASFPSHIPPGQWTQTKQKQDLMTRLIKV